MSNLLVYRSVRTLIKLYFSESIYQVKSYENLKGDSLEEIINLLLTSITGLVVNSLLDFLIINKLFILLRSFLLHSFKKSLRVLPPTHLYQIRLIARKDGGYKQIIRMNLRSILIKMKKSIQCAKQIRRELLKMCLVEVVKKE